MARNSASGYPVICLARRLRTLCRLAHALSEQRHRPARRIERRVCFHATAKFNPTWEAATPPALPDFNWVIDHLLLQGNLDGFVNYTILLV